MEQDCCKQCGINITKVMPNRLRKRLNYCLCHFRTYVDRRFISIHLHLVSKPASRQNTKTNSNHSCPSHHDFNSRPIRESIYSKVEYKWKIPVFPKSREMCWLAIIFRSILFSCMLFARDTFVCSSMLLLLSDAQLF